MNLYHEQIIDLAKHPLHRRELPDATLTHSGVNVTCGDHVRVYLKLSADQSEIQEATWEGEGCAISLAIASMLSEELHGMTLDEVRALTNQDMFDLLGVDSLGPARVKCAVLCLETVHGALASLEP